MNRVIISPAAIADLNRTWNYIYERNPIAADRLIDRLFECFESLGTNPLLGELREDLGSGVRMFCQDGYGIYYSTEQGRVRIARVLHGRQDEKTAWSAT